MGYSIRIGELEIIEEPDGNETITHYSAKDVELEEAPHSGNYSGHTNLRLPSYTGWSDFMDRMKWHFDKRGLEIDFFQLFYQKAENNEGYWEFKGGHPGYFRITQEFVDQFNTCFEKAEKPTPKNHFHPEYEDYNYKRLFWLHFWINWAFENCENPVVANS